MCRKCREMQKNNFEILFCRKMVEIFHFLSVSLLTVRLQSDVASVFGRFVRMVVKCDI